MFKVFNLLKSVLIRALCMMCMLSSAQAYHHGFKLPGLFPYRTPVEPLFGPFPAEHHSVVPAQIISENHGSVSKSEVMAVRVPSKNPDIQMYLTFSEFLEGVIDINVNGTSADRFFLHPLRDMGLPGQCLLGAFSCRAESQSQKGLQLYNETMCPADDSNLLYWEYYRHKNNGAWDNNLFHFEYDARSETAVIRPGKMYEPYIDTSEAMKSYQMEPGDPMRAGPVCALHESDGSAIVTKLLLRFDSSNVLLYDVDPRMATLMDEVLQRPHAVMDGWLHNETAYATQVMYDKGFVREDEALVMAHKGDLHAQFHAGLRLYAFGNDAQSAQSWLEKADAQGHTNAPLWLGQIHSHQNMTDPEQRAKVHRYFEKASSYGDPFGQLKFGLHLAKYASDPKDMTRAQQLFWLAAQQGDLRAQLCYGKMCYSGKGGARNFTESQGWIERAARRGYAPAQYFNALMHHLGVGVPADPEAFRYWLRTAAMNGHHEAQTNYAMLSLKKGWGLSSETPIHAWIEAGERRNDSRALFVSAYKIMNSPTVLETMNLAVLKLHRAAEQNMSQAQFWLGQLHLSGLGVKMNVTRAFEYLRRAAIADHPQAQLILSSLYANGYGVERNEKIAEYWIKRRARHTMSSTNDDMPFNMTQLLSLDT